jgi:hypothetical protein
MRAVDYFSEQPLHRIAKPAEVRLQIRPAELTMMMPPGAVMKSKTD